MRNRKIIIISSILLILLIISSSTYAYWKWRSDNSNKTNVSFTIGSGFSCSADGGGNITNNDVTLIPTSCTNSPYVIKRTITTNVINSTSDIIYLNLWLEINNISSELADSTYFRYALTDNATSCTSGNILSTGSFFNKNDASNNKVDILFNDRYSSTATGTYYLYIWLDTDETDNNTQDATFDLELKGECVSGIDSGTPNAPELVTGLIPVKLSPSGDTVTAVSANDSTWYNYYGREWANAVLVKESGVKTRAQNSIAGTEIDLRDILAYYVWIPRYEYKTWVLDGVDTEGPHEIEIRFTNTNTTKSLNDVENVGDYYTQPAFWWDNDNDGVRETGEELSGIWVGKFEASNNSSTTNYISLPSLEEYGEVRSGFVNSITNVKGMSDAIQSITNNGNIYGLSNTDADSHMIKNSEWGAIAYLSHSKFGINGSMVNNKYTYPGCREISDEYCYGKSVTDFLQSTTGNVTGVFDMIGGQYEYVMGFLSSTYTSSYVSSLESKYYEIYTIPPFSGNVTNNINNCTFAQCGGKALSETMGWYGAGSSFVSEKNYVNSNSGSSFVFFLRGTHTTDSDKSIFSISANDLSGYFVHSTTSRYVLISD